MQVDKARCEQAAKQGYANATELADYLVERGIPFRTAHDISGQAVVYAIEQGKALEELTVTELQQFSSIIQDDVYPVLQLEYLVDKRNILGGTGKEPVTKAIEHALAFLAAQQVC
jgi:argininosuccinate lyase